MWKGKKREREKCIPHRGTSQPRAGDEQEKETPALQNTGLYS